MLLLPYNSTIDTWSLFCTGDSNVYNTKISELRSHWVFGSSKGWLGVVNEESLDVLLFNPMTGSRIILPRLDEDTIDGYLKYLSPVHEYDVSYVRKNFICKAALWGDPSGSSSSQKCQVGIIFSGDRHKVGIWQVGETGWTEVSAWRNPLPGFARFRQSFCDVIGHGKKIYALSPLSVSVIEYTGSGYVTILEIETPIVEEGPFPVSQRYITISKFGDLYFLARHVFRYKVFKQQRRNAGTKYFDVFTLDKGKNTWTQIYDLGDSESFFVGCNESVAFSTEKCPWLRPNCVYFVDDDHLRQEIQRHGYQYDNGIYSLEKNCIVERFNINHSVSLWSEPAIWYQKS